MANIQKTYNSMGLPMNINRSNPIPVDNTELWYSLDEAKSYAKSDPRAYVGQSIKVIDETSGEIKWYLIGTDGELVDKLEQLALEIPSLDGFATEEHVSAKVAEHETTTQAALAGLKTELSEEIVSESTEWHIVDEDGNILLKAGKLDEDTAGLETTTVVAETANIGNIYTKTEVDAKIADAIEQIPDVEYPVTSVNGKTGDVTLTASDVGALPSDTAIPSIEGLASETFVTNLLKEKSEVGHTHTISVEASDDDVIILEGTGGADAVSYTASHAKTNKAGTYRSVTVNEYGHVTDGTNPTTITEYGITDAYTKDEIDSKLSEVSGQIPEVNYPVESVNGKTGTVQLTAEDVGALPSSTEIPSIAGLATEEYVKAKIDEISGEIPEVSYPVTSVNTKTGDVTLTASDVGALPADTVIPSIAGLATEEYVNSKIDEVSGKIPEVNYPVTSVNGKTGAVALTYADVNALPDTTEIPSIEGLASETFVTTNYELKSDASAKLTEAKEYAKEYADDLAEIDGLTVQLGEGGTIGGYKTGDVITAGTSIKTILNKLLQRAVPATYTAPTASLANNNGTASGNIEAGSTITPKLRATFTQNDAGNLTSIQITKNNTSVATGTASPLDYNGDSFVIGDETVTFGATAAYEDAPVKNNNLGEESKENWFAGSSVSASAYSITGKRQLFYGTGAGTLPTITSDLVRGLSGKKLAPANGNSFNVNVAIGQQYIVIAYPSSLRDINNITYVESNDTGMVSSFTKSTLQVADARGGQNGLTGYKVYTYAMKVPAAATMTFKVTI